MRKAIERFLFITACCSLLGMLPLQAAQAQESAPVVNLDIASHFTPEVSPPAATLSIAPIDPLRFVVGACAGHGGNCLSFARPAPVLDEHGSQGPGSGGFGGL
jgi:hypothetical protein